MKHITLIIGLLVVGCCTSPMPSDTNESTPTTNTNEVDGTTEKPVRELTAEEKKIVGTYEAKIGEDTIRIVFLENGLCDGYINGKKEEEAAKWKVVNGEVLGIDKRGIEGVFKQNKDGSLTSIARIVDGERKGIPKEEQNTFKKIK